MKAASQITALENFPELLLHRRRDFSYFFFSKWIEKAL